MVEEMSEEIIKKSDLLEYSFYDDNHNLVTVVNEDLLKKVFNADIILLHEYEHK